MMIGESHPAIVGTAAVAIRKAAESIDNGLRAFEVLHGSAVNAMAADVMENPDGPVSAPFFAAALATAENIEHLSRGFRNRLDTLLPDFAERGTA